MKTTENIDLKQITGDQAKYLIEQLETLDLHDPKNYTFICAAMVKLFCWQFPSFLSMAKKEKVKWITEFDHAKTSLFFDFYWIKRAGTTETRKYF